MTYSLSCGDVMPGCKARFVADREEDLLEEVGEHATADHGIVEITPELIETVRSHTSVDR